jgi:transcriptional regulator with XRE-family HTH domain
MIETLSQYVRRVMKQKRMSARDIERNCGKKIDNSYISKIINGAVTNLTANAIVALAQGLEVNPHELFTVVSGRNAQPDQETKPDSFLLVDMMQQLVMDPELMEVLQVWVRLLPEDRTRILESLRFLNEKNQKKQQETYHNSNKRLSSG